MTVYYIPIEPLEERYTESWYRNIPFYLKELGDVIIVDGDALSTFVETGTFLDINSTVHYKSSQLKKISELFYKKLVKPNDIFFIADIEFWGIESIRFLAHLQNIPVKIYGFCHAASYTTEDFMEPSAPYSKYFELGWIAAFDMVFVGSKYHKDAIISRRIVPYVNDKNEVDLLSKKIIVTGNPFFQNDYNSVLLSPPKKKKQIIISNRFDWEKRPNLSLDFCYILKRRIPDLSIIVTTSRPHFKSNKSWLVEMARWMETDGIIKIYDGLSKGEYHYHLAESKVFLTNTIEENFGYCLLEALLYNTYPVAENKFSHPEILDYQKPFLFNDTDEIIEKVITLLSSEYDVSYLARHYFDSMHKIVKIISNNI